MYVSITQRELKEEEGELWVKERKQTYRNNKDFTMMNQDRKIYFFFLKVVFDYHSFRHIKIILDRKKGIR